MQRILVILAASAALAACSTTKLDDQAAGAAGSAGAEGQSTVTQASTEGSLDARGGPQDVARVLHFDFDSYVVRADARPVVEGQARWLNGHRDARVTLEGHTDEVGGREYNLALGQKRAEAVRQSLRLLGVNDSQVEAVSFGKERPEVAGSGNNEQNRRVEFRYKQ